jgi:hypothetical protein
VRLSLQHSFFSCFSSTFSQGRWEIKLTLRFFGVAKSSPAEYRGLPTLAFTEMKQFSFGSGHLQRTSCQPPANLFGLLSMF